MFSKSCKYAIRAVLYLALNSDENKKIGVEEIAKQIDVPRHFLAKTLQLLTKRNIISSIKGPNGGFYLNKKNRKSNLYEVIEIVDGNDAFISCVLGVKECSNSNPCPYHHLVIANRNKLERTLKNETIEQTAKKIKKNNYSIEGV